jgi:hypothetical protein
MVEAGQVYWNSATRSYETVYYRDDLPNGYSVAEVVIMRTQLGYLPLKCRKSTWKSGVPRGWVLFYEPR